MDRLPAVLQKLFRRALIWLVALCVAFYVPLAEAGVPIPLEAWESKILKAGKFSDVFLATVAMVVLSASDLADNIMKGATQAATVVALADPKGKRAVILVTVRLADGSEYKLDAPGPFAPLAQVVAEYMSLVGPWSEDGGEHAGESGYQVEMQ